MKKIFLITLSLLFLCRSGSAAVPITFTNGTVADATEVNQNFNYFENKFSTTSGHAHDGSDSKSILLGEWQGTVIDPAYGGTGNTIYASGDFLYATDNTSIVKRARGTYGSILIADVFESNPNWLVPGTAGKFLKSLGTATNPGYQTVHQSSRIVYVGGNLTTTDTVFADMDATNVSITLTTEDNPVLIGLSGNWQTNSGGSKNSIDITIDGIRQGQDEGLNIHELPDTNVSEPIGFVYQSASLSEGSHVFRPQWKVDGNTGTFNASTNTPLVFWVVELGD